MVLSIEWRNFRNPIPFLRYILFLERRVIANSLDMIAVVDTRRFTCVI